jgi:hypothetical protein
VNAQRSRADTSDGWRRRKAARRLLKSYDVGFPRSGPNRSHEPTPYGQKIRTARKVGQLCHSAWARRALSVRFLGRSMVPLRTGGQMGELMEWARILAYISGTVDQELLLRNEYLAAENQILRGQLKGRPKLSDAERAKLGEIGRRLGRKALGDVATAALPDTILGWYRRLVARKFDGSKHRSPGRPRVEMRN